MHLTVVEGAARSIKIDEVPRSTAATYSSRSKLVTPSNGRGPLPDHRRAMAGGCRASPPEGLAVAEDSRPWSRRRWAEAAWQHGDSPLKCLMYRYRLDELALAQATGPLALAPSAGTSAPASTGACR